MPYMSQFCKTRKQTQSWLNKMEVDNFTIRDDLTVDVGGSVHINWKKLKLFSVRFGNVSGSFHCSANQLTSLTGAPESVGQDFCCHSNKLTSLKDAPKFVGGNFDCSRNKLTSLEGAPRSVGDNFYCFDNSRLGELQDLRNIAAIKAALLVKILDQSLDTNANATKRVKV